MLATDVALSVDALKTLSVSSAGSATTGFSSAVTSLLDEGSSAIFLQNSAVNMTTTLYKYRLVLHVTVKLA